VTVEERQDLETRRAAYRATAEALEVMRIKRLATMTDDEAQRIIATLMTEDTPRGERREWSGLVEQQAIFRRRRGT
jgi:hypothetical protein